MNNKTKVALKWVNLINSHDIVNNSGSIAVVTLFESQLNLTTHIPDKYEVLNYSTISRETGVEVATIQNYYEILEETHFGFHLSGFHKSFRKQQRQSPKFYFFNLP